MAGGLWPWLLGFLVIALGAFALWLALRRPRAQTAVDLHEQAVERWLAGDLNGARDLLSEVVRREPARSQPYLQLGILLRLTGQPGRAAALHRNLAVREDLPPGRRVVVGLELAADLLALSRSDEAEEVLSQLSPLADDQLRWYELRFAATLAQQKNEAALAALREGERKLVAEHAALLQSRRAAWLCDRTLLEMRAGNVDAAGKWLHQAAKLPEAGGRVLLLRALLAAAAQDEAKAVAAVAEGLARFPAEMAPFVHLLEGVLLDAGRFTMVIPILENACRDAQAPPSLWMALARLYEKLDRRDDALRLLAGKRGDPRLTPDAAASYLRLLTSEHPQAAFSKVWNLLGDPGMVRGYRCGQCGRREEEVRWFCPTCLAADSFAPAPLAARAAAAEAGPLATPPRY